ncbi:hypothetical protein RFI_27743 [Reticulomyxa filosa]|uniref:Uncharacterized protein n=1 Tax=Reticulomyxa filosa TaxID=46433 RepID=X6M9E0_RETFI|nr:hypothetical protein RFI_27743 [Reticulomyxa filosa]|eukprot:ETO09635.1 hypothetical protein RFI_27743 [Reticulomyxa filosa]
MIWGGTIVLEQLGMCSNFDQANQHSVQILQSLPRYGEETSIRYGEANWKATTYAIGLGSTSVVFLVLAVIGIVVCPFWCACRSCACCSSSCKPKALETEPPCFHKWGPYVFVLILSTLMVVFTSVAYDSNKNFSYGVVNHHDGMLQIIAELLDDLEYFVNFTVLDPLLFIKGYTIVATNNVSDTLKGSKSIINGTDAIVTRLGNLSEEWTNYTLNLTSDKGNTYTFTCGVCNKFSGAAAATHEQIQNETDPLLSSLNNTANSIQKTLVSANGSIISTVSGVVTDMESINKKVHHTDNLYTTTYRSQVQTYNQKREIAYIILFIIPLVPIIFVLLGGWTRKSVYFTMYAKKKIFF